jgi:hypothetical protein
MIRITGIAATTHIDLHGDRFTREALEDLVGQASKEYIPINVEHDFRVPPLGRTVAAKIVKLEDGESGVEIEGELFENGEVVDFNGAGRKLKRRAPEGPGILYDLTYQNADDQKLIDDIASLVSGKKDLHVKKSIGPLAEISILLGTIASSAFTKKIFERFADDTYDLIEAKIGELIKRHRQDGPQCVTVSFSLGKGDAYIDITIFLDDPSDQELDSLKDISVKEVENRIAQFRGIPELIEVVMRYEKGGLMPVYGVRSDGVPFAPSGAVIGTKDQNIPPGFSVAGQKPK